MCLEGRNNPNHSYPNKLVDLGGYKPLIQHGRWLDEDFNREDESLVILSIKEIHIIDS